MNEKSDLSPRNKFKYHHHYLQQFLNQNDNYSYCRNDEIHELFKSILPILQNENEINKSENTNNLIEYLMKLKNFSKIILECNEDKLKIIFSSIFNNLKYEYHDSNNIIFKYGDFMDKFYIIFEGKIDVLIVKEKMYEIYYNDYLRYLGFLIGYGEYEMLKKVISLNGNYYPLEIKDIPSQYGKIIQKIKKKENPKIIHLKDIMELLLPHELEKFENNFKELLLRKINVSINLYSNKEKNISTENYINRLKNYKRNEKYINRNKEIIIKVKLLEYCLNQILTSGDKFGESNPFSEQINIYDYTVISSSKCHLGIIEKDKISHELKELIDKYNKNQITKILSSRIFNSIPIIIFSKKYFNYFLFEKKNKNDFLIKQNEPNDFIYILQDGIYEISGFNSLHQITKYINYLSNFINIKENENLILKIRDILNEDKKLLSRCNEIESLNKYYKIQKIPIKILIVNFPDIAGLDDCYYSENSNIPFFSWEIKSNEGNYFKIQRDFFKMIVDISVIQKEKEILIEKSIFLIKRLIEIRKVKLEYYFNKHPDYYIFQEYINKYNKKDEDFFYKIKKNNILKRRKSMSNIMNKVKFINAIDCPNIFEEKSKRIFQIKNKNNIDKEIFITKKYNNQNKNIENKNLKISIKKKLKKSKSISNLMATPDKKFILNKNNNSQYNSLKIYNLIIKYCPLTSITARHSLELSKKENSYEILPYQVLKQSNFISERNKNNIRITRDIFLRFKKKGYFKLLNK